MKYLYQEFQKRNNVVNDLNTKVIYLYVILQIIGSFKIFVSDHHNTVLSCSKKYFFFLDVDI